MRPPTDFPRLAAEILQRLRARRPRVHCITNAVAQNFTANVLLAAGALPSMTISPEEVASFAASADALLVNLGTFDAHRRDAADTAIEVAIEEQRPWVLDPVFIDRSEPRAHYARAVTERKPSAIRLNATEFRTLAGAEAERETLMRYALEKLTVLGVTGEADLITDGARVTTVENGHLLMTQVTAMGCAASALTAACLAVEDDAQAATAAALLAFGVAGELAGESAKGPGSFALAFIDALHGLSADRLLARARVL